jgi:hypothetical protein
MTIGPAQLGKVVPDILQYFHMPACTFGILLVHRTFSLYDFIIIEGTWSSKSINYKYKSKT